MNDAIEKYIKDIKKNIYHLVPSDEYLEDLRQNLLEYAQQFPGVTYTDLVEQFGKPEDLAAEFVNDQKPYSPRERAIHRNKLRIFLFIALAIIVILILLIAVSSRQRQAMYSDVTTQTEGELITE